MARWRLFGRSKEEDTLEEAEVEPIEESGDEPLVEYSEKLHTGTSKSKTYSATNVDQRIWRNVDSIEEKVDNLHITKANKPVTELDKTVDRLIEKKQKK